MKRNKLTALAMAGIMMASSFAGLTAFAEDGNTVAAPTNTTGSNNEVLR
ncbi:MAG: hypothetical protein ACI4D3_07525 [Lachnospiraceae bacterium]